MSPIVCYNNVSTELNNITGISDVVMLQTSNGVHILQNCQLVAVVRMPIMKIVRAIRKRFSMIELTVVI